MENFKQIFESHYTWIEGFLRNVRRYGNRLAMVNPADGRRWTYRELDAESNRFAQALLAAGLRKGDVIMMQLCNCPEFVFGYLAAHKTGAVGPTGNWTPRATASRKPSSRPASGKGTSS